MTAPSVTPNGKTITLAAICQGVSTAKTAGAFDFTFITPLGQEYWCRDIVGCSIVPGQNITITFSSN